MCAPRDEEGRRVKVRIRMCWAEEVGRCGPQVAAVWFDLTAARRLTPLEWSELGARGSWGHMT